jgi:hypothetical protein
MSFFSLKEYNIANDIVMLKNNNLNNDQKQYINNYLQFNCNYEYLDYVIQSYQLKNIVPYTVIKYNKLNNEIYALFSVVYHLNNENYIGEIYNVCTNKKYRRQNHMSDLLKAILKKNKIDNRKVLYSLGVDISKPYKELKILLKLYNNSGFYLNPFKGIKNTSNNITFLEFNNYNYNNNQLLSLHLYKTLYGSFIKNNNILLTKNLINYIKNYLDDNIIINSDLIILPNNVFAINKYNIKEEENCNIYNIDNGIITFYTYPDECYIKKLKISNFLKFLYLAYLNNKTEKHFLFSKYGIFLFSLTLNCKFFIDYINTINKQNTNKDKNEYENEDKNEDNEEIIKIYKSEIQITNDIIANAIKKITDDYIYEDININTYRKKLSSIELSDIIKQDENIKKFLLNTGFDFKIFDIKFIKYKEKDININIKTYNNLNSLIY